MCNGKVVGFIYDKYFTTNKAAGTIAFEEGEDLTPAYSYGYLLEASGASSFPGATITKASRNAHTLATYNEVTGKYDYTLVSTSADKKYTKTVNFSLDVLLDEVDRTGARNDPKSITKDRLYWDNDAGEYMVEVNTKHVIFKDSTGWRLSTGNANLIDYTLTDALNLIPSDDQNGLPMIETNYYKIRWPDRMLVNGSYGQCTLSWDTTNKITYGHMLGKSPSSATKEEVDALFTIPMHVVYAIETRIIATGIKKKIKVPLFGNGTTFGLQHTDILYDGDAIKGEQVTYGSIKIEVPCTDPVVYEMFEGETITPSVTSDTHVFYKDAPVYLESVTGAHTLTRNSSVTTASFSVNTVETLGTRLDNGKYRYTVTATSADGTKIKDTTFDIDYQLVNFGGASKMYWNSEQGCYDVSLHAGYEYITDVTGWPIYNYSGYTIFTKATDDGKIAYSGNNSASMYADGTMHVASRSGLSDYYNLITSGSDQNGSTLGISMRDIHDHEAANQKIAENEPIQVLYEYNADKVIHTNIKKKIKLPWFGEGTTYTLKNGNVVSNFKIGLPTMYQHRIAYKEYKSLKMYGNDTMTLTIQPTIKDTKAYDICYSYDSYIDSIEFPGYYDSSMIRELAIDNGDGTYSYNLEFTTHSKNPDTGAGIINVIGSQKIKLPYLLEGYSYTENRYGRDRMYWDADKKQYMIEKRIYRMYIDTAYGDIDFRQFETSMYNLNGKVCWEFAIPSYIYDHIHHPDRQYSDLAYTLFDGLSNYNHYPMNSASSFGKNGVIFAPAYYSTFDNQASLVFYHKSCRTLEQLDAQLKAKPIILSLPLSYYYKGTQGSTEVDTIYGEPEIIPTGIKKKIKVPVTKEACDIGLQIKMKNVSSTDHEANGILNIKVPVEYKTVVIPEPNYQLPAKTVLSGSSSGGYIDTGVKLFDIAKDSTVIIDFENVNANGSFTPEIGDIVFHCRYESSSYNHRGFSLVYNTTYNTWEMKGDTSYNSGTLGNSISNSSGETYNWRYRYAFIFKKGVLDRAINLCAESISSVSIPAAARFYDTTLYSNKPPYGSYSKNAYIGRRGTSSANYYQGTIHDCKIWIGTALTDEQIEALYESPYPKPDYELPEPKTFSQTYINTGVCLYDTNRDFSIVLDYTATQDYTYNKGFDATAGYAVLSSNLRGGQSAGGLALMYRLKYGDYRLEYRNTENMLKNGGSISPEFGRMALIIIYKQGLPYRVLDCTSGVPVDLELRTDMTPIGTYGINVILGASYHEDTSSYAECWMGTINKCMIMKDKVLNDSEIDYICKYILK